MSDWNVWIDGTCLDCGSPTIETDARIAPKGTPGLSEPVREDYWLACMNPQCPRHVGECMGDMECPPEWANHDEERWAQP